MKSVIVALVLVSSLAVGVAGAGADEPGGHYTVRGCPTAAGPAGERGGWFSSTFPEGALLGSVLRPCGPDGAFALDATNRLVATSAGATWTFLTPDPLRIERVRFERRIRVSDGFFYALQTALTGQPESTLGSSAPAPPIEWTAGAFEMHGGQWLFFMLSCAGSPSCTTVKVQSVSVRNFEADVVDPSAPTLGYRITTDQAPPTPPSTFTLTADAADTGSGVRTISVLIDGVVVGQATGDGSCATSPYPVPEPCPESSRLTVPIARDALERGTGQLEVEAVDAAGNRTRTPPTPLWKFGYTPTPAPLRGVLSLAFKGTTKTQVTSRYAAPPTITGVVRDATGAVVPGVTVRIDTKLLVGGATFAPLKSITTDKNGAFAVRLPRGPSREIQATALSGDSASVAVLRASVAAPLRLTSNRKSTRNHRSIRFTGSVPGTPKGARTRIDLQALGGGGRWLTFASPTLKNGKFGGSYRFTRTFSPSTYRFRALLRSDPAFPYAAGKSREVRVRVRP